MTTNHEAHGICRRCRAAAHQYPSGWAHVMADTAVTGRTCIIDPEATCCDEHAGTCYHGETDGTVARTAHGYLNDAPAGTVQTLCGGCGTTLADSRGPVALPIGTTIYSGETGTATVTYSAVLPSGQVFVEATYPDGFAFRTTLDEPGVYGETWTADVHADVAGSGPFDV